MGLCRANRDRSPSDAETCRVHGKLTQPFPGVRIVECGAKEESEKKSEGGKEGEGESKKRM